MGQRDITLNLHRGLRLDQPKRRYLRRHDLPMAALLRDHDLEPECDDLGYGCPCGCEDGQDLIDEDMHFALWEQELWAAVNQARLADRLRTHGPGVHAINPVALPAGALGSPRSAEQLVADLHAHGERLEETLRPLALCHAPGVAPAWPEICDGLAKHRGVLSLLYPHRGAVVTALLFAPFWVRPLGTWVPTERSPAALIASLVEHLFGRYPIPAFLRNAWIDDPRPARKWAQWTILLGQGGSLVKAAPHFGWVLSGLLQRHLLAAPADLAPVEACMWALVAQEGGSRVDLDRLRRHDAYRIDPTDGPARLAARASAPWQQERPEELAASWAEQMRFFQQTVAWVVRHRDALPDSSWDTILDWAVHQHTEGGRPGQRPFSWSGRTARSAQQAAEEYQRQRRLPYVERSWQGRGWDWEYAEAQGGSWSVRELTSGRHLHEEGQAMRHCVATYVHRCASGACAIFSVRYNEQRRLTVEITPEERRVIQARGMGNRAASAEETAILQRWLRAVGATGRGGSGR